VILKTREGGNRELRLFEASAFIPRPGSLDAMYDGSVRTPALEVAAVACAVRLVSELIASMVMRTYIGDASERRPVLDSSQARLFQEPAEGWTSFDMWSDTVAACELGRHAFIWKVRTQRQVEEIYPIDPDYVRIERDKASGTRMIQARIDGKIKNVTRDVIPIRGWAPLAAVDGIARPEIHRKQLQTMRSFIEFQGRYFENDAATGVILNMPGQPNRTQRKDIVDSFVRRRAGSRNGFRVGTLWGGVTAEVLASNMTDAQGPAVAENITRTVAQMWGIFPVEVLHATIRTPETPEAVADKLWRVTLMPRARRLERAFHADVDLFPDRALYPKFDASDFVRGDIATTATVIHELVQVGVLTKNEGRAMFGLPPIPGGDVLIEIPVGGGGDNIGPEAKQRILALARRLELDAGDPVPAGGNGHP